MTDKHWKALSDVPTTFGHDLMSVIYYAGVSWIDDQMKNMFDAQGYGNGARYLWDGTRDTFKQDYLINLIGKEEELESESLGTRFFY